MSIEIAADIYFGVLVLLTAAVLVLYVLETYYYFQRTGLDYKLNSGFASEDTGTLCSIGTRAKLLYAKQRSVEKLRSYSVKALLFYLICGFLASIIINSGY